MKLLRSHAGQGAVPSAPSLDAESAHVGAIEMRPLPSQRSRIDTWQPDKRPRLRSLSVGAPSVSTQLALKPLGNAYKPSLALTHQKSPDAAMALETVLQVRDWRQQYALIEQRVDQSMGLWARRGFSRFVELGRGIALAVGAIAGMLTFVVGPHHLVLAVGISGVVYGGMVLLGLMVELSTKWWTYNQVHDETREELKRLCEELNARALLLGAERTLEERSLCDQANGLWTECTFNARTIGRTLASAFADWRFDPLKPQRKAPKAMAMPEKGSAPKLKWL